ncbi:GyrI-like domain-containing protein [bacterium]|nr:GyrI-like domain-containing protein [bacterium]
MVKHTLYAVSLGLILFFLYLFQYTGAFKSVTIDQDERGPYTIIYKTHVGAYHKIVSTIQEIEKWSRENGLKCRLSFGEFFDDPRVVEEGRLNSRVGCLIDPLVPDEKIVLEKLKSQLPQDYKIDEIQKTKAVVALFTGAPGIGPLKVYPKAEDFIVENKLTRKGSVIEIYEGNDNKSMQTTYIWPIQN